MATIAEIIATCTSIKVLQHNNIVVNRPHDIVNRQHDIANRRHDLVNRTLTNRALDIVNGARDIVNHGSLTPVPLSMCFGTNGAPYHMYMYA